MKTEEIIEKKFSRSVLGYDMEEVDRFLDEIADQFEAFDKERKEMLSAMDYMLRELEKPERKESEKSGKRQERRKNSADIGSGEAAEKEQSSAEHYFRRQEEGIPGFLNRPGKAENGTGKTANFEVPTFLFPDEEDASREPSIEQFVEQIMAEADDEKGEERK